MRLKTVLLLVLAAWPAISAAHYYHNVRVNDTPIRCLAQDESNLIWLGTGSGLYCYDGYRSSARYAWAEPMHATVYSLLANGYDLYVGTADGFYVYDTQTGACHAPQQNKTEVRALAMKGKSVLAGLPDGLWEYDLTTAELKLVDGSFKQIYSLAEVAGTTYVGTLTGLFSYQKGSSREIILREGEHPYIIALLADEQRHCLWIGAGDMLYQYDLQSGHVREFPEMRGVSVKSMSLTKNGTLYIATDNGFYTYTNDSFTLDKHDSQNPHTLADNVVWSTMIDRWGNIVLGTDGGLSVVHAPSYYAYQPISHLTGQADGNKFSTIFIDSKGRKWLGGSNGLILMDKVGNKWFRQADKELPISHNRIRRVYEDLTGTVWVATDNGINIYDEQTGRMRMIVITDQSGDYTSRWAYDLLDDGKGRLWVAAFSGGIFIVPKEKLLHGDEFVVADMHIDQQKSGLSDLWVRQLVKDDKGHVWARTRKGLDRIDLATQKVTSIGKYAPGFLTADKNGNIWVANTQELLCYGMTDEPQRYSYGVNQADVETVAVCDVNGQIWVVTSEECILIGDKDDSRRLRIPSVDAYGAYYSSDDRCIYIGGQDGLVEMYPSEINSGSLKRKLLLTDLLINGEQRQLDGRKIVLRHHENTIELRFTDLPYTGDVSFSYAYQFSGVDDAWHLMKSLEEPLVYSALPPGRYTLTIRTLENDKSVDDEAFTAEILILPPWYLSWWAKTLYLLLLAASVLWIMRFYMVRKQLAREKREKLHIMEQSKARMDFYNNMSQNLKKALHQVMAPVAEMETSGMDKDRQMISVIRSRTTQMNTLIRQAFDMGNILEQEEELQLSRINVVSFCQETVEGFRSEIEEKHIQLAFKSDSPEVYMQTEVLRFDSLLSILLQNILKYADNQSSVALLLKHDEADNRIQIRLHGSSMNVPESLRPYLFQRFIQAKDPSFEVATGYELYLAKEYVEELGGRIAVEFADEGGTDFMMTFESMAVESQGERLQDSPEISEKDERLLREVTAAIERNLIDSDFNVTKLQETVGYGQKLLYRKIKQMTGVTPVEYIRNIRLEKAALLLREGKFSISEVMYMVGFTKSGYFSKCFQEAFGMTPSAYIKKTNK